MSVFPPTSRGTTPENSFMAMSRVGVVRSPGEILAEVPAERWTPVFIFGSKQSIWGNISKGVRYVVKQFED